MSEKKKIILTSEGFEEKKERLEYLRNYLTVDIAEKLKEARSHGDLSENAEYDAAKNEQAEVAAEIEKLETMLKNVEIVSKEAISTTNVSIGTKVVVLDCELNEELNVEVVGASEVNIFNKDNEIDFSNMRISSESPLGAALIGHQEGDIVEVSAERGIIKYEIKKIGK